MYCAPVAASSGKDSLQVMQFVMVLPPFSKNTLSLDYRNNYVKLIFKSLTKLQGKVWCSRKRGVGMSETKQQDVREVSVSLIRRFALTEKECPVCGKTFKGTKKARYCSSSCRNRAHYLRHAEQYRQNRKEIYRKQKAKATKAKPTSSSKAKA